MLRVAAYLAVGRVPLRALLAVLFLLMSALQPGLYATANATGLHGNGGMNLRVEKQVQDTRDHDHHDHGDAAAGSDMKGHHGAKGHHDGKKSAEKSCEVHCAPGQAVPVECPDIEPVLARCFALATAATLPLGEYTALIRPPRQLN